MGDDVKYLIFAFGGILLILLIFFLITNWSSLSSEENMQATKGFLNIKTYN
jgi:hypothetical protein